MNNDVNTKGKKAKRNYLKKHVSFWDMLSDNRYTLLAAFCTAFVMMVVYYCFNLFPFGEVTILRMDLYHQYGPLYAEFYDRLTGGGSFLYSWETGGGGSFLGNFANYVSSPFSLLMLLFGHKNMPEAIAAIILIKASTASFTASYYFKSSQKVSSPIIAAFGVLYSMSGFFIAYYWNVMWLDAFYLLPLAVLGIEKLINERKQRLYFVILVLTALTNYYMTFMFCVFSVLYFLTYYFGHYSISDTYFGKLAHHKEKKNFKRFVYFVYSHLRNSRFIDSGTRFALTAVGAVLTCAFLLVPIYYILMACSATSDAWPADWKTYFSVFDFLANHLAYLEPTIRSSGEDVLPNVYCGVLPLMLVILYLFSRKTKARERAADVVLLGVFFASFYVNKFNFFWHGLHFPNDLPYRFSYMYSFFLIIIAFKAFQGIKEFSTRQILGTGLGLVAFAILVQELGSKNFSELTLWITLAFIGIYIFALSLYNNDKYPRTAVAALLLCAVCAEYTVANTNHYSMDQTKSSYAGSYTDFVALKKELNTLEGNDHYRMELSSLRARMDPAWYGYNGVSTFSSMAYEKVSNLQYQLGMYGNYINSHTYNPQTPVYNAMFALDYIVDNCEKIRNTALYTETASCGIYTAYKNNYTLPIAFRVNSEILGWQYDETDPFAVQNGFIDSATGLVGPLKNIMFSDDAYYDNLDPFAAEEFATGTYYYSVPDSSTKGTATMHFTVPETQNVYLYLKCASSSVDSINITSDYGLNMTQSIDTKPYILDMGILNAGEVVTVEIPIENSSSGILYLYAAGLDMNAFKTAYNVLRTDSLNVTSFTDTKINGEIDVSGDGVLYTSINYDEGWSVYIDGVKLNKSDYARIGNALLGVPITAGHHTVSFKYFPQGMFFGIAISIITLAIFVVLLMLIRMKTFAFTPKLLSEKQAEQSEQAASIEAMPPVFLSGDVRTEDTVIYYGEPMTEEPGSTPSALKPEQPSDDTPPTDNSSAD